MNKRIKELALQAGGIYHNDDGDELTPALVGKSLEKFAELIVAECISTLNKRFMGDLNREDMEVRRCIEDVKKHFGVEE